ncbi:MAG: hypothetical protein WBD47_05845 [Phormidesmis sp.]
MQAETTKHATFSDVKGQQFEWDYDEKLYSLSAVCRRICEEFGGDLGSGSFAGPDYWAIEGEDISLAERARLLYLEGQDSTQEASVVKSIE